MIELIPAGLVHVEVLAGMHNICFSHPWNRDSMAASLATGTAGLIAVTPGRGPAGMVLWRVAVDEAEILTLAVLPDWRRRGLGTRLLEAACDSARDKGASAMFLEVADGNGAALDLYKSAGFTRVGLRRGYYGGADALVMRRDLSFSPPGGAGPARSA